MSALGPELLGRILDEHAAALVLYARQWCDSPEDVVQEAVLALVRQRAQPVEVAPWLFRVVRNGAIAAVRRSGRRRRREQAAAAARGEWFLPTEGDGLDAAAASAALAGLPLEEREAIVARLWGGLSFEQIGQLSGTSSSTAHRRYQAGLAALRERLGVTCPDENPPKKN